MDFWTLVISDADTTISHHARALRDQALSSGLDADPHTQENHLEVTASRRALAPLAAWSLTAFPEAAVALFPAD